MALTFKQNNNLSNILHNEKVRYQLKGFFHIFLSILQVFLFFYYIPEVVQWLWRYTMKLGEWKNVFLSVSLLMPIVLMFIYNGVCGLIYYMKHPFFEQFRILNQAWPWEQGTQEERRTWWKRMITYGFLNKVVVNFMALSFEYYIGTYEKYVHTVENLPSKFEYLWQIAFYMICDDIFFYFIHRLFHWKPLYRLFHKVHHEHHSVTSFSALMVHPVDHFLCNVVSSVIGYKILGQNAHYTSFMFWNVFRALEAVDGHSGYEFPWSMFRFMPFSGSSDYHNFHHSKNVGNYGSFFTFWDTLCGTNNEFFKFKENQENKLIKKNKAILSKQIF